MNKFQNVSFNNIDEFLEHLPENELKIVNYLRQIIFDTVPNCTEKLAYNVPFYYYRKRFCFIWPSSVPWGKVKRNGVEFGFTSGHLLNDIENWLDRGNRKQVFTKTFFSVNEIETDYLKDFIIQAIQIDKQQHISKDMPLSTKNTK